MKLKTRFGIWNQILPFLSNDELFQMQIADQFFYHICVGRSITSFKFRKLHLSFVMLGESAVGKSTIAGHLIYKLGEASQNELDSY